MDASGEALGEVQLTEELLDVSAAGRYVAALFSPTVWTSIRAILLYTDLKGTENAAARSCDRTAPSFLSARRVHGLMFHKRIFT